VSDIASPRMINMSEITFYGIVAILSFFVGMGAYQLVIGIYAAIRIMGDKK